MERLVNLTYEYKLSDITIYDAATTINFVMAAFFV